MVLTRANRGASDQPAESGRSARLARRRGGSNDNMERELPARPRAKGKQVAVPSSDPGDDEEDEEEDEGAGSEEEEIAKGESIARFNAPRGNLVKSISPPPQSESDIASIIGSQSVSGVQRFANPYGATAQYTRHSRSPVREDDEEDAPDEGRGTQGSNHNISRDETAELRENALDPLWSTTNDLAKYLLEPKPDKKTWNQLLKIQRQNWASMQTLFTNWDNEFLIDLPDVLSALPEKLQSRGRVILAATNATSLQNELIKTVQGTGDLLDICARVFERLDQDFPAPFLISIPDDPYELITNEVIELTLDIRVQKFIAQLRDLTDHPVSPANIASDLFCAVDEGVDGEEALRHGPYQPVCGGVESPLVSQRARSIAQLIEEKTVVEAIHMLEDAFPFMTEDGTGLSVDLMQWTADIIGQAQDFLREPAIGSTIRSSSPSESLASSSQQEFVRKDVPDDLSADGDDILAIARGKPPPSSAAAAGPSTSATRSSGFTPVNGTKRPSATQDPEDPFENDTRSPDPSRRAQLDLDRQNMPPPASRPQKRQRLPSHPQPQPSSSASSSRPTPSPSTNPAAAPPSPNGSTSSGAPPPSSAASTSLLSGEMSFSQIRESNRLPPSRAAGAPQRQPWSDTDTRRLIRLIEVHECKWAVIARRQDPDYRRGRQPDPGPEDTEDCVFEIRRDQQAIRDKARNLKVDLLKADFALYPGFNSIALGKKERAALIARGKNPDRREEDTTPDGVVHNTTFIPDE
ncbi:hypothetical protein COL26b_001831 [Colletotrichum chrysophilum]|uniref:uncharacterized protein n=1 Tax=Colletotrichum chrysophilum TaxID=1836956 RepID=UPI0023013564|nr:uncharacterized protein COL26b_001831 [Colletotrichum chrysophilum]KAJ0380010.1 hypothetical protein COL26b_001831 [Colletotrichum chrysophilum]